MTRNGPRVVVIGGGTGSFTVLSGLKQVVSDITALVSMADDGGSTGQLRDDLGVLPPGDVRQCLVALSNASQEVRNLFTFRFEEGNLAGHSFGNLFLSALEKMTDNFGDAVRVAGDVLQITGCVAPITLDNVRLVLEKPDGTLVQGQSRIDHLHSLGSTQPKLFLEPAGRINPEAAAAIARADLVVIAPGDVYTSLAPLLLVDGVAKSLAATKAKIVYVCNLVVKPGHTEHLSVAGHAAEIERFAGGPVLDYVLYNTAAPNPALLTKYAQAGELQVPVVLSELDTTHYQAIGTPLLSQEIAQVAKGDRLAARRSLIRHEPVLLAQELRKLATN